MELATLINSYIMVKGGSCEVYAAPFAVFINKDDYNYVEQDISVICDKNKLDDCGCNGAPEMVKYADEYMPHLDGKFQLKLFGAQEVFIAAAKELGYEKVYEEVDMQYTFDTPLERELPKGFRFVPIGLAAAALSELYRRMKPLGATHMTGGSNPFYEKIGYKPAVVWTHWMKK